MSDTNNIRVIARFRPLNQRERTHGGDHPDLIRIEGDTVHIVPLHPAHRSHSTFHLDDVLGQDASQHAVYEAAARRTVEDVMHGYNGTIFAYGQTGSGKSHTMLGPENSVQSDEGGIIPRACGAIFQHIAEDPSDVEFTLRCSFLEVYRETVRDLLNLSTQGGLKVRETPERGVWVEGLSDHFVSSEREVLELVKAGERFRSVACTNMNATSSRSHSLFTITIQQRNKDGSVQTGRLCLADLAGSEKIDKTGATGTTLEEAKKINQSLSALGNCIHALSKPARTHVPFRDSKLTFILRDSLGGNSKTTLIVNCSPHASNIEETTSTLQFAARAKLVTNSAKVNRLRSAQELTLIIAKLNKEIEHLKVYVAGLEQRLVQADPRLDLDALRHATSTSSTSTSSASSTSPAPSCRLSLPFPSASTASSSASLFQPSSSLTSSAPSSSSSSSSSSPSPSPSLSSSSPPLAPRTRSATLTLSCDAWMPSPAPRPLPPSLSPRRSRSNSAVTNSAYVAANTLGAASLDDDDDDDDDDVTWAHFNSDSDARVGGERRGAEGLGGEGDGTDTLSLVEARVDLARLKEVTSLQIADLQEEVQQLRADGESNERKMTVLQAQLVRAQLDSAADKNALEHEREAFQDALAKLQYEKQSLELEAESLKKATAMFAQQERLTMERLARGGEALAAHIAASDAVRHAAKKEVDELASKMDAMAREHRQREAERDQQHSKALEDVVAARTMVESQQDDFRTYLQQAQMQGEAALSESEAVARKLQASLDELKGAYAQQQADLESAQQEAQTQNLTNSSLRTQVAALEHIVEFAKSESELHQRQSMHYSSRIDRLERDRKKLITELEQIRSTAAALEAQTAAMSQEYRANIQFIQDSHRAAEMQRERAKIVRPIDRTQAVTPAGMIGSVLSLFGSPLASRVVDAAKLGKVIKEGELVKQGSRVKSWKRRWVVLKGGSLYYYTPKERQPKGMVKLDPLCLIQDADQFTQKALSFAVFHPINKPFYLVADTEKDRDDWIKSLKTACAHADGDVVT